MFGFGFLRNICGLSFKIFGVDERVLGIFVNVWEFFERS
jgi:hypothetical protein